MAEVIVRAEAESDLLDIYAHGVDEFGIEAAQGYMAGIDKTLLRLADHPMIGPVYPGLRTNIRYLAYKRHHIFYDFDGSTVWIVRVLHHAMNAKRVLMQ